MCVLQGSRVYTVKTVVLRVFMGSSATVGVTVPIMDAVTVCMGDVCAPPASMANSAIYPVQSGPTVWVAQRNANAFRKTLSLAIPKKAPVLVNLVTTATAARQIVKRVFTVMVAVNDVTALLVSHVTLKLESVRRDALLDTMEIIA